MRSQLPGVDRLLFAHAEKIVRIHLLGLRMLPVPCFTVGPFEMLKPRLIDGMAHFLSPYNHIRMML